MRKYFTGIGLVLLAALLISCAPVIRKELMDAGIRDVPLSEVKRSPGLYTGRLFVLGGIIANTRVTTEGSLIEAIYVPVDSRGYLRGNGADGRYLALFPKESGMLDPVIYRPGKRITIAGELVGTREGKIDESDYLYPFFTIREIYLWEETMYYYPHPYHPYWWDYPYWLYGPSWRYRPFWW